MRTLNHVVTPPPVQIRQFVRVGGQSYDLYKTLAAVDRRFNAGVVGMFDTAWLSQYSRLLQLGEPDRQDPTHIWDYATGSYIDTVAWFRSYGVPRRN